MTRVLAIETSCDETSAAVVEGAGDAVQVRSLVILSQDVHRVFGGVVPEIASRAHLTSIVPVVGRAVEDAGLTLGAIDAIAVTHAPGLVGPPRWRRSAGLALAAYLVLVFPANVYAAVSQASIDGVPTGSLHRYCAARRGARSRPPCTYRFASGPDSPNSSSDMNGSVSVSGRNADRPGRDVVPQLHAVERAGGAATLFVVVDGALWQMRSVHLSR